MSRRHRGFSALALTCFLSSQISDARAETLDSALKVIGHFEKKIERIQFQCESFSGVVLDVNNLGQIGNPNPELKVDDFVLFEPFTKRIRREMRQTAQWLDGAAPYLTYDCSLTFDGRQQRELCIQNPGKNAPAKGVNEGVGEVSAEDDYGSSKRMKLINSWMQPLTHFPPFIYGKKLSETLREANDSGKLHWQETKIGEWIFRVPAPLPATGETLQITYDPNRGALLGAEWIITIDGESTVWKRLSLTLAKLENEHWVPTRIDNVNVQGKNIFRQEYKNVKLNQPVSDDLYVLEFPVKTLVVDHVEKKRYQVGPGMANDQAAILSYAQMNGLRLTENAPETEKIGGGRTGILVAILLVVAALFGLLVAKRKRGE